jgi:proline racemase/trans-L-3-hydroxyproline dehydratase
MKVRRFLQVVDTHTAGEPTRVVLGGFPHIPGETMEQRRSWLAKNADDFRMFLLQEPRGHDDMFGAIVTPPTSPAVDLGLIFLDGGGYLGMCGHGTIGAMTALASLGWTTKEELFVDTPSGLVQCRTLRQEGEVQAVTLRNVPSFYLGDLERNGVHLHIAYGGNLFALVEVKAFHLSLEREALPDLVKEGIAIRRWVNQHHTFQHPVTGAPLAVELVEFYEESVPPRNVVVFGQGQVDRSPCGTGTCAKMAFLYAQGSLRVGDTYHYQGILGTEFTGRVVAEAKVGDNVGIVPEITGSAYITGMGALVLTEGDPFPTGFSIPTFRSRKER